MAKTAARSSSDGTARPPAAPQTRDQSGPPGTEERLIAFLKAPEAYPHGPTEVRSPGWHRQDHYRKAARQRVGLARLFLRQNSQNSGRRCAHTANAAGIAGQNHSARITRQTYNRLLEDGLAALKKNPGVILNATFSTRALRTLLCDECKKAKVPFQFVELQVDSGEIKRRLKARDEKTAETSDARLEDFAKLNAAYQPPSELAHDLIQIPGNNSVAETVKAVLNQLVEKQIH